MDAPRTRLRALMLLRYLEDLEPVAARTLLKRVIGSDLDFIRESWRQHAFDLCEEYKGQDYYTRVSVWLNHDWCSATSPGMSMTVRWPYLSSRRVGKRTHPRRVVEITVTG